MKEKKSLKTIPLSLRGKKRYIYFKVSCLNSKKLSEKDVNLFLKNSLLQLFGEIGLARQRIKFIEFYSKSGKGIVRCAHDKVSEVETGILFLTEINSEKVIPELIKVSGTIKKLKK